MAIKLEQLAARLTLGQRCYLISGDEILLVQEAEDLVRQQCRDWGIIEREVFHVSRGFDFSPLSAGAESLSLFAEQKLVELRLSKVPDKTEQQELEALLSQPGEDTVYLISCPKLDKRQWSAKWINAIEEQGLAVQIWPVAAHQMAAWIEQRAGQMNLKMTREAIAILAQHSEGNLLSANQDLQKLTLNHPGQSVTAEAVLESVANNARYTVFELVDTALLGDYVKMIRIIGQLKAEAIAPILVVSSVYRECRQMFKMATEIANGLSVSEVTRQYRIWSNRQKPVCNALQRVPLKVWQTLLARCAHLDKVSKGLEQGNLWDELTTCLMLMGGRSLWRKVV